MTETEYQSLFDEMEWRFPGWQKAWEHRLVLLDSLSALRDLAIDAIGRFQHSDCQLNLLFGVPAHLLYLLRKLLMRLRVGGCDDNASS